MSSKLVRKEVQLPIPTEIEKLTELFRRNGARDPESWASSQSNEGINQLHRFLFLQQAWSKVVDEKDDSWIDSEIANSKRKPDQPFAGIGLALSRILDAGGSRSDVVDIVRGMQVQALFSFCYLLDDPSLEDPELQDVGWSLVETTEDFEPTDKTIGGLHESVLDLDPTGREMRPREAV